jgi:hypothetical protein
VQGQIREGTTTDSRRRSVLLGKQWFRPAVMAFLSKWKQTAVVLLGDFPTVVKGRMGVARHGRAPQLVGWA